MLSMLDFANIHPHNLLNIQQQSTALKRNSEGLIQQQQQQQHQQQQHNNNLLQGQLPLLAGQLPLQAQCANLLPSPALPGSNCTEHIDAKKPKLEQMSPTFAHALGGPVSLASITALTSLPHALTGFPGACNPMSLTGNTPAMNHMLSAQLALSPPTAAAPPPPPPPPHSATNVSTPSPANLGAQGSCLGTQVVTPPLAPHMAAHPHQGRLMQHAHHPHHHPQHGPPMNHSPPALGKPSKVLHFRGVPSETTEGEIIQLGQPFGKMTNLVLAKKKNQALLEMTDIETAQQMAVYFADHPPMIRGRVVYIQYSNHEELKVEASQQAALAVTQNNLTDEPKTVLRVIVEQMAFQVTIDTLKQVFSKYGTVLKIVTFNKNNSFQALIEYADSIAAQTTKLSLNGQNIYNGCCNLRVDFSKLATLNVKFNNEKSRDYTNNNLPTCDMNNLNHMHAMGNISPMSPNDLLNMPHIQMPPAFPPAVTSAPFGSLVPPTFHGSPNGSSATPTPAGGGALTPFEVAAVTAAAANNGFPPIPVGGPMNFPIPINQPLRFPIPCSPVLLISGLNEELVSTDSLFMLFGVYGDVIRVKILFNKKDTALIQFSTALQAQVAMQHLDRLKIWGKIIKCAHSKHLEVQLPREGQSDAGLTKDYSQSPLHRFKKPNSKNHHNIFPPSSTLHLSNIPSTTNEDYLLQLFESHGKVIAFKFFQRDHRMALVQMDSIEEAVFALMALHNSQLAETAHLRVSFSKSTINSAMEALKM